jgi:enoyl-CoA hydratase/carnithine racemase
MSNNEAVLAHLEDGNIGIITLNRPANRNSMTPELLEAFQLKVAEIKANPDVRCVIITGTGSCFSAGADFKSQIQREVGSRKLQAHERSYAMYIPFLSVLDIEVPVIAAMNGHAIGGGFGLALTCDMRIANEGARYGASFARLGLHSGMAISYLLPRLIGVARAAELLFTGRVFSGEEAASLGIANQASPGDEVLSQAMKLAREIASCAPIAVRMMKRTFYQGLEWKPREAAWEEAFAQAITIDTRDAKEGMAALLEKRPPVFTGE